MFQCFLILWVKKLTTAMQSTTCNLPLLCSLPIEYMVVLTSCWTRLQLLCYPFDSWLLYLQLEAVKNEMTKLGKQCEEQKLALQQRESSSGGRLHQTTAPLKQDDSWNAPEMQCKRLIFL